MTIWSKTGTMPSTEMAANARPRIPSNLDMRKATPGSAVASAKVALATSMPPGERARQGRADRLALLVEALPQALPQAASQAGATPPYPLGSAGAARSLGAMGAVRERRAGARAPGRCERECAREWAREGRRGAV